MAFRAGFLWVVAVTALLLFSEPAHGSPEDARLLAVLRPDQRTNVTFVTRQGVRRTVVYAPIPVAPSVPAPAISKPAISKPPASKSKVADLALAQTPTPGASRIASKPPIVVLDRASPAPLDDRIATPPPDEFVSRDDGGGAFVPTATVGKPDAHPTPQTTQRDLAWLYAHRFDTPAPGAYRVPGVPVRSQVGSPFDIGSGAFHGVRSTNGWSAVRATVSIPCGASRFSVGPGRNEANGRDELVDQETGYEYVGGWGAGPRGAPVDAGLQKSSAQAARDAYAVYWKYAGNAPVTSVARFPCGGPDVVLELYPVTDQLLIFSATGVLDSGRHETITVIQETHRDDGWDPSGGSASDGIILKRLVSIAQPATWRGPGHLNRFTNGSYFGVDSFSSRTPRIVWRNCEIGRVAPPRIVPTYRSWTNDLNWYPRVPGIYLDWPPLAIVRSIEGVCDAAGIALRNG